MGQSIIKQTIKLMESLQMNKVQHLLDLYWDYKIPVNLDKLVKNMGLHVRYVEYIEGDSPEYKLTGRIDQINGLIVCSINSTQSNLIQRFTLAHLIGHYICNHGFGFKCNLKSFDVIDSKNLDMFNSIIDPRNIEANKVAIQILMPEVAVNHLIQKENITDIAELTRWFEVSQTMMLDRLKQLDWLK